MAAVTRAEATAQVRRTIAAYRDRVHEVRNDTDRLPPAGARIVDEYCLDRNDEQTLVLKAIGTSAFLDGMDDALLLEYCAVCMELDDALGLGSWRIGKVDRIIGVADLSRSEKIKRAIECSDVLGEILEEIGDINALAVQMVAVSAVLIGLAATGYGAVAEALGLALLAVGAALAGADLIGGISGLVKFFTAVDDAKSEEDLKSCGRLFGDAVAKIGVNGLFFVLSMFGLKKASARITTKTIADNSLNARKWKGKKIEDKINTTELDENISRYKYNMIENPGPLAELVDNPAKNFFGGRYNIEVLAEDKIFYRAGMKGKPLGRWFTNKPPESVINVRIDMAVKPQWIDSRTGELTGISIIDTVYKIKIPKGTTVYTGPVGAQGEIYCGGVDVMQTFIETPWQLKEIEVLDFWSIK